MNWIKCSDRLPEEEEILAFCECGSIHSLVRDEKEWKVVEHCSGPGTYHSLSLTEVWFTHWMPLPEPPSV